MYMMCRKLKSFCICLGILCMLPTLEGNTSSIFILRQQEENVVDLLELKPSFNKGKCSRGKLT